MERWTITDQWIPSCTTLKTMAAGMGRASFRKARPTRPSPMTMRANHSGVASNIIGGTTKASSMCWIMCTE